MMNFLKSYFFLFVGMLVASGCAHSANWIFLQGGGGTKQYFDADSITKNGKILNLKLMHDDDQPWSPSSRRFKGPKTQRTSRIWNMYIDCSSRNYLVDYMEVYSEHMGTGILVEAEQQSRGWVPMNNENKFVSSGANLICAKANM